MRWENHSNGRYYEVRVFRDLFEGMELLRTWGTIGTPNGVTRRDQLAESAIGPMLKEIAKRREDGGYKLTAFSHGQIAAEPALPASSNGRDC